MPCISIVAYLRAGGIFGPVYVFLCFAHHGHKVWLCEGMSAGVAHVDNILAEFVECYVSAFLDVEKKVVDMV
jgi:hypothetical protein